MKDVKSMTIKTMSFDELMNCKELNSNRCGCLNKEEALAHNYTEVDWQGLEKRAKKLKSNILKNGFREDSLFWVAKNEKGTMYILDGQGRRLAVKMIHDENKDFFGKGEFNCVFCGEMSIEQMTEKIRNLNTGNKNWLNQDVRRCDAMSSDDEEVIKAYKHMEEVKNRLGVRDYVANLLVFGEKGSHTKANGAKQLKTSDYRVDKDVYIEAYERFLNEASYTVNRDGEKVLRGFSVRSAIRSTNFAISFVTNIRRIIKACQYDIDYAKQVINYFIDGLIRYCDCNDDFLIKDLKGFDKSASSITDRVKKHFISAKSCKADKIREAFYANSYA